MKLEQLEAFLTERGYKKDRWGHFKMNERRYKIQKRSVRLEKQIEYSDGSKGWIRIATAFLGQLTITPENKLKGFKR